MCEYKTTKLPIYCVTCEWWELSKTCHRRSPTRNLKNEACWPKTSPTDRCGDWGPAEADAIAGRKMALQLKEASND